VYFLFVFNSNNSSDRLRYGAIEDVFFKVEAVSVTSGGDRGHSYWWDRLSTSC